MAAEKPSRRSFMKTTAAVTGAMSVAGMTPSTVLGANDRVNFGVIGTGGMGRGHLRNLMDNAGDWNIRVPVVCDVYQRRLNQAKAMCNGEGVTDYRKVLDRKDIDAVLIATPDHWHAKMAIEAMESGKHVYLEKPMTLTIQQALDVRNKARETGKKLQVGPQGTSVSQYWNANEAIKAGRLGKITWAHGSYNRNVRDGAFNRWFKIDETAGPGMPGEDEIDWKMWLGHEWGLAPRIPWNPEHFFRFRKYFQYNGGVATDLLYHILAPLLVAITGENGEYPHRVSGSGGLYLLKDGRDIPDVFMMTVDYKSEFSVILSSILTNNTQLPRRVYGQYGTIEFEGHAKLTANGDYKQEFRNKNNGYDEITLHSDRPSERHANMEKNLIDAIREDKKLYCNAELGAATMVAIKMGVEAYRQGKTLMWDAENEKVIG